MIRARPRHAGRYLWLLATAAWVFLLRGFVSTLPLVVLSLTGPLAVWAGVRLAVRMGRQVFASGWSAAGLIAGVGLVAGGLATLLAGAPDRLLVSTAIGWDLLDRRVARLQAAITANDRARAHRLLQRGVGDARPEDTSGQPLIHGVERPEMLAELLEHGLDPDATNDDGQTRLMLAQQPELARLLLAAGANLQARDRLGRAVADYHPSYGPVRPVLEAHAGGALKEETRDTATVDARIDWLRPEHGATPSSRVSAARIVPPAPGPGDEATLTVTLVNPTNQDRRLDVRAELGDGLLFVSASAGGAIARPGRPRNVQAIHWPLLALPANREGQLELRVVRRADPEAEPPVARFEVRPESGENVEAFEVATPRGERPTAGGAGGTWSTGIWLLALLPLALLARAWMRRLREPTEGGLSGVGRVAALLGSVATGGIAVALAWSAVEPYARFESATCTILDRRVFSREMVSRSSGSSSPTRSYAVPLAAVRIDAGGPARVATGFTTGMATHSAQALRRFALGARVPCWVDPAAPSRFTLIRQPPLSLVAGLILLAVVALAFVAIVRFSSPSPSRPRGRGAGPRARRAGREAL